MAHCIGSFGHTSRHSDCRDDIFGTKKVTAMIGGGIAPRCKGTTTLRVVRLVALRGTVRTTNNEGEGSGHRDRRLKKLLEKLETLRFGNNII